MLGFTIRKIVLRNKPGIKNFQGKADWVQEGCERVSFLNAVRFL